MNSYATVFGNFSSDYKKLSIDKQMCWEDSEKISLPSSADNGENLLNNIDYSEKENLFKALDIFEKNSGDGFEKVLFYLIIQLRDLTKFQHKIELMHYTTNENKNDILQIEKYISLISGKILHHPCISGFNPKFFHGLVQFDKLDSLQRKIVFMLLFCANDENFDSFTETEYTYKLSNLMTILQNNRNDNISSNLVKIIKTVNPAF